ncbi:MAG: TetR family transcriptional regulator [Spartobacteria bacterium]|nr:TetR family transcriptional regulator [Spartobacteria bacterium]
MGDEMFDEQQHTTREKILHCACELFADRGYRATTIQDICAYAEANIASVNYYFGNKETLYGAAWEYALSISEMLGGRTNDDLPPREWIERVIEQRIRAIFSEGPAGWLPKFIHNEHHDRSHMSESLHHKVLGQFHQRVAKKISAYFEMQLPEAHLRFVTGFVVGMMPGLVFMRYHAYQDHLISEKDVDTLISNAKAYIFGGLDRLRDTVQEQVKS